MKTLELILEKIVTISTKNGNRSVALFKSAARIVNMGNIQNVSVGGNATYRMFLQEEDVASFNKFVGKSIGELDMNTWRIRESEYTKEINGVETKCVSKWLELRD